MLKVGERLTVDITETNIFGNGVCRVDGMLVFVEGAIATEKCIIEITRLYPKYAYGKCVEIICKSKDRVVPSCPQIDTCGGCTFSSVTLEHENKVKYNYVKSSFLKQKIIAEFEETVCPVSQFYRNKVVLYFNGSSFGYMAKSSNKIVPHISCELNEDIFDKIASFTAVELKGTPLRALYLRKSSSEEPEIMVCPVLYEKIDLFPYTARLIERFPNVKTVIYTVNGEKNFALENAKFKTLYGDGYINDTLCGLNFRISPESFYQVNKNCAEMLYEKALNLANLDKSSACADLFCGTGTIGIIAAYKTGATVYGVEIVEKAVEDAKANAKANRVKSVHFEAMDASCFNKTVDTCIIDPPRKGCSDFMIDTLKRLKSKKIVYVSCNVDTMTRDIKLLLDNYEICAPVSVFNLFPRTSHVETVAMLSLRNEI